MASFVLVPGACHGGWWFEPLAAQLRAAGHLAWALTLAGLDPGEPESPTGINLDSHVGQVVDLVASLGGDVVLVGHSYAGSVITAVADRRPSQVQALVYIDAFVPEDGDSCWSMTNDEQREWYASGSARTGLAVDPLPFFDDRARPHPLGAFMQAATLTGAHQRVPTRVYAVASDPAWTDHSPFVSIAARLRDDAAWTVVELPTTHNVLADGPDLVRDLLLAVVR